LEVFDRLGKDLVCVGNVPRFEIVLVDFNLVEFEVLILLIDYEKAIVTS